MVSAPKLLTSEIKSLLLFNVFSLLLQHPASNIIRNQNSEAESLICVLSHVLETADKIRESFNRKLGEIPLEEFHELVDAAIVPFQTIRQTLRKLEKSVNRILNLQRDVMNRINSVFDGCSELARQPFYAVGSFNWAGNSTVLIMFQCTAMFNELYYQCLDKTFDVVCEPLNLLKRQCYITRLLNSFCEWPAALKKQIEEGVNGYVKNSLQKAVDITKKTTFYSIYESGKEKVGDTQKTYETLSLSVLHDYDFKLRSDLRLTKFKNILQEELSIFTKIIKVGVTICDFAPFLLSIWPILSAFFYVIKFNKFDDTDNYFINDDVVSIDEEQKKANGQTVFPLNNEERKTYVWMDSIEITNREKFRLLFNLTFVDIAFTSAFLFIMLDVLIYGVLNVANDFFNNNSTYIPKPNAYQLKVSGTGFISKLLSNILRVFQPINAENHKKDDLWRKCMKAPTKPAYRHFAIILALLIMAFFVTVLEVYTQRWSHFVATNYYPQRQLPRAQFVHRKIMNSRKTILNLMQNRVRHRNKQLRLKHAKDDKIQVNEGFDINLPNKSTTCSRCCRDDLSLTNNGTTRACVNCASLYCIDCYSVRKKCIDCEWNLQKVADSIELYVDSSCSDED